MGYKDNSKPWFETGDYPDQSQFYQLFDYLRWKDEPIQINEVEGLQTVLNQLSNPVERFITTETQYEYNLPIGYLLEKIIIEPVANCSPYCSFAGGTGDIIPEDASTIVSPAEGAVWIVNIFASAAIKNIIVNSIPVGTILYFIKRKIK